MIYTYIFSPRALGQYKEAYEWYMERSEIAGQNFRTDVMEQVQQICQNPTLYRNTKKQFREAILKKYPFAIVYIIHKKTYTVYITSIFHNKRNPKGKYTA